ncbi:ADP-ribosyl-[dinitrogen reductase] hydrolase [Thiobacillus sp.]|uniref:ADP-ribosyl-[dinitrogen reductase] hydrolase n=1 Tax=Thiobacillus sp. TaxID=924 RepID=UPI0025F16363|nr:ADP-ribosyl-[dinitrogen reductase] hydrolase [Thiobacillus sp.]MBT9540864.1 ADP-ribosyl-[dinitrogen reductase] hydrolase [Thiobacillus sp.]
MEAARDALYERALGAYLGFAVGDALGATVEFMMPSEIQHAYGMHRDMIGGGWLKLKPGQITDDTQMSLALGQSIIDSSGWNAVAAADAFVAWLKTRPVDVGNTCRRGIQRYMTHGTLAGEANEADGGNGACMRNLPLALATLHDEAEFAQATREQCHLTHHHPLSDAATLALGRMAQILIHGGGIKGCRAEASRLVAAFPAFRFEPYPRRASGYIVDTTQTVLHYFFITDSFESCVTEVVNRGEDADTNGALAGMLAGAAYGASGIPGYWLKRLDKDVRQRIETQTGALLGLAQHVKKDPR